MPNWDKMRKKRDIEGLTHLLVDSIPKNRINAAQALKDIGDSEAISALTEALFNTIRFGKGNDPIEAMIIMQGRIPASFMRFAFSQKRIDALEKVRGPLELNLVLGPIEKMINEKKLNLIDKLFSLLTLVELGDRREVLLDELIASTTECIRVIDRKLNAIPFSSEIGSDFQIHMFFAGQINRLIEETIRALASFKDNLKVRDVVSKILDDELFRGSYVYPHGIRTGPYIYAKQEHSIYALGAIGSPSERERIKYMANRGSESISRAAKAALELYGKAFYDEIKAKAESKKKKYSF